MPAKINVAIKQRTHSALKKKADKAGMKLCAFIDLILSNSLNTKRT